MPRRDHLGIAVCLALAACGSGEEANGNSAGYPSRDWSGTYLTHVESSSTDCYGVKLPPYMTGFGLQVQQFPNNRAAFRMNPMIALAGELKGDAFEVRNTIAQPISLPDSILSRIAAKDSLGTIDYTLSGRFEPGKLTGSYVIRAPDMSAIVRGVGPTRCEMRYELAGVVPVDPNAPAEPAEPR